MALLALFLIAMLFRSTIAGQPVATLAPITPYVQTESCHGAPSSWAIFHLLHVKGEALSLKDQRFQELPTPKSDPVVKPFMPSPERRLLESHQTQTERTSSSRYSIPKMGKWSVAHEVVGAASTSNSQPIEAPPLSPATKACQSGLLQGELAS
jgi:hypothetical protein